MTVYFAKGMGSLSTGDLDQAIVQFTKVIEVNLKHADAYKSRGLNY